MCFQFSGDHALAYVRSRSGYSYFDPAKGSWVKDGTSDLGRISRQQDFIRRAMQRALDKGSSSPRVANELLNTGLRNVITDDQLSALSMLQLAQAMRNINTSKIPSYTISSAGQMIGEEAVLVPKIQNDTMRQVLALFQGKASFGTSTAGDEGAMAPNAIAVRAFTSRVSAAPSTTVPAVAPEQDTLGIVPPDDPSCR
jgi:anionic cell wall polymer biosynthesis LytR-Cps2A-Psr (LCP) family protein